MSVASALKGRSQEWLGRNGGVKWWCGTALWPGHEDDDRQIGSACGFRNYQVLANNIIASPLVAVQHCITACLCSCVFSRRPPSPHVRRRPTKMSRGSSSCRGSAPTHLRTHAFMRSRTVDNKMRKVYNPLDGGLLHPSHLKPVIKFKHYLPLFFRVMISVSQPKQSTKTIVACQTRQFSTQ